MYVGSFLLVNGLSFVFSGISEIFIDFKAKEKIYGIENKSDPGSAKNNFLEDLKQGLKYIISQKWLVVLGSFTVFFNIFYIIGISVSMPYIAVNV